LLGAWRPGKPLVVVKPAVTPTLASEERAKADIEKLEPVGLLGKPVEGGRYVRTSEFFKEADEATADRLKRIVAEKTITEWAKGGAEQTVPIASLLSSQATLHKATLFDDPVDPAILAQTKGGLPMVFEVDGQLIIKDGHHRLAAIKASGATTAKVVIVRLPGRKPS